MPRRPTRPRPPASPASAGAGWSLVGWATAGRVDTPFTTADFPLVAGAPNVRAFSRSRNSAAVGRAVASDARAASRVSMNSSSTPGMRSIGSSSRSNMSTTFGVPGSGQRGGRPRAPRTGSPPGVHVTGLGRRSAVEHLGRRVRGGDGLQRLARAPCRVGQRGQPEVGQPGVPVGVDQDVGRLHVAVQHSPGVGGGERVGDPDADLADLLLARPRLALDPWSASRPRTAPSPGRAGRRSGCPRRAR